GADLKSRIYQIQMKEISCKSILANLDRFIQFVWSKVFYRAKKISWCKYLLELNNRNYKEENYKEGEQ
ncbi:MAG: hypothetical protein WC620_11565, partial [Methanoregula sp.]